ncbi:MAG: hypothetical protein JW820_00800 [Spirochaetales bacterium]|nr:hypothetical protein [Spirochaetales bacterium]
MPGLPYSIVVTLGPATDSDELVAGLLEAGADALRLNGSHLGPQALARWLTRLGGAAPVVLDLQGSKWRLGEFPPFALAAGDTVELVEGAVSEEAGRLPVPHPDFFAAAPQSSPELRLDDARCLLQVEDCAPDRLRARVVRGGTIRSRKGITFSRSAFRRESLAERDLELVRVAERSGGPGVRLAVSYVRDAAEMTTYRRLLGPSAYLIAKIERATAVGEAAGIAETADELWLCRGDLGAEMGARGMAEAVHRFSSALSDLPVPALLAGQVFEHMTRNPSPTRSEVCFLYEALLGGFRGVVLSDETAVGDFPLESCRAAAMFR